MSLDLSEKGLGEGEDGPHGLGITVRFAVRLYLNGRRSTHARLTVRNESYVLHGFADHVGEGRLARTLRAKDVDSWLATQNVGRATIRRRLSMLKGFTHWLVLTDRAKKDACLGVKMPKPPRSMPRELPAQAVTKTLLSARDPRDVAMICLMAHEGLRAAEVASVQVGDLDRLERLLRVVGKGGHERWVAVSSETLDAIGNYLGVHPVASGPIIRSYRTNLPLTAGTVGRYVMEAMVAAGIKARPRDGVSGHALRHTAAGALLDDGADLRDVSEFLGHANLATTSVYTKRRGSSKRLKPHVDARKYLEAS